ncbi:MAG: hypothetical protein ABIA67_05355 [Candidatus Margulisiibacteriota bacterium]
MRLAKAQIYPTVPFKLTRTVYKPAPAADCKRARQLYDFLAKKTFDPTQNRFSQRKPAMSTYEVLTTRGLTSSIVKDKVFREAATDTLKFNPRSLYERTFKADEAAMKNAAYPREMQDLEQGWNLFWFLASHQYDQMTGRFNSRGDNPLSIYEVLGSPIAEMLIRDAVANTALAEALDFDPRAYCRERFMDDLGHLKSSLFTRELTAMRQAHELCDFLASHEWNAKQKRFDEKKPGSSMPQVFERGMASRVTKNKAMREALIAKLHFNPRRLYEVEFGSDQGLMQRVVALGEAADSHGRIMTLSEFLCSKFQPENLKLDEPRVQALIKEILGKHFPDGEGALENILCPTNAAELSASTPAWVWRAPLGAWLENELGMSPKDIYNLRNDIETTAKEVAVKKGFKAQAEAIAHLFAAHQLLFTVLQKSGLIEEAE